MGRSPDGVGAYPGRGLDLTLTPYDDSKFPKFNPDDAP
jgi:hypothetical protein